MESFEYAVVGLGALGSATAWHLARHGHQVIGLERFGLGHHRGASGDTSRIIRHSYHTPAYVRLTFEAYRDWAALEMECGRRLVTSTGGVDLFPPGGSIPVHDYTGSMDASGVPYEILGTDEVAGRWPQFHLPAGTITVYQSRTGVLPAAQGVACLQARALAHGAALRDHCPVSTVRDRGSGGVQIEAGGRSYRVRRLIITADAWTNSLLAPLDWQLPLTVTQEQVTYFAPSSPSSFAPDRFPVWIWMDDPSFYGFPVYGEPTIKAAQDCGGPVVSGDDRSFEPDPERLGVLAEFMARTVPGSGPARRSVTCLYTLTPDRDFVLGPVPGHDCVLVGLGAAHGFKFAPTLGRLLADLATGAAPDPASGTDLTPFRLERPALTDANHPVSWLL